LIWRRAWHKGQKNCGRQLDPDGAWILEEACGRAAVPSIQSHFLHPEMDGAGEHARVFQLIDFG
jgi:hypothetical protein